MKQNSRSSSLSSQEVSKSEDEKDEKCEELSDWKQENTDMQSSIDVAFHESRPLMPKKSKVSGV